MSNTTPVFMQRELNSVVQSKDRRVWGGDTGVKKGVQS